MQIGGTYFAIVVWRSEAVCGVAVDSPVVCIMGDDFINAL